MRAAVNHNKHCITYITVNMLRRDELKKNTNFAVITEARLADNTEFGT
jgi:hypothetical protein